MKQKKSISPLLWIMLFDQTCLSMTFPVLTLLFFDPHSHIFAANISLATRSMWYGLCVSIPYIINLILTPILSLLSDAFGRKKILLVGTLGAFLFAITSACGILWGLLSLIIISRIIQGVFSRINPIAQAIIGDMSLPHKKLLWMGYLQTAISIGAFIGPIAGGFLANPFFVNRYNFSLPFLIAAIFAIISFLITLCFFKETFTEAHSIKLPKIEHVRRIKNIILNKTILRISLILLLSQISWSMYYQFMPPILKTTLHFNAKELGLFVGCIALWLTLITGFGIRVLERLMSPSQILIFSIYLVLTGILFTFVSCLLKFHLAICLAAIPIAGGDVLIYSCLTALYSNATESLDQGKVMGICFIIVSFAWGMTGILGGYLMSLHPLLPLIVAPSSIIAAIWLLHYRFKLSLTPLANPVVNQSLPQSQLTTELNYL